MDKIKRAFGAKEEDESGIITEVKNFLNLQ